MAALGTLDPYREDVLAFVQMARRDFQKPEALHFLIFHKFR
jgi:hypothetical protein